MNLFLIARRPTIPGTPFLGDAWRRAIDQYLPNVPPDFSLTIIEGDLRTDTNGLQFDCLVSPANSFGIMDGGYDLELSHALGGVEYITHHVQTSLAQEWRGYAPPGSCTVLSLPEPAAGNYNQWNARAIAVCPTMRIPQSVDWHKDLVYNTLWSLFAQISQWNRLRDSPINSALIPGLGAGVGGISVEKCAHQMILAIKHFHSPSAMPTYPHWDDAMRVAAEIEGTYDL